MESGRILGLLGRVSMGRAEHCFRLDRKSSDISKKSVQDSDRRVTVKKLECGPMPNVMVALPNAADAHY